MKNLTQHGTIYTTRFVPDTTTDEYRGQAAVRHNKADVLTWIKIKLQNKENLTYGNIIDEWEKRELLILITKTPRWKSKVNYEQRIFTA